MDLARALRRDPDLATHGARLAARLEPDATDDHDPARRRRKLGVNRRTEIAAWTASRPAFQARSAADDRR